MRLDVVCTRPMVAAKMRGGAEEHHDGLCAFGASSNNGDSRATMRPRRSHGRGMDRAETGSGLHGVRTRCAAGTGADLPIAPMTAG